MKPRNKYERRVALLNATLKQDIAIKDVEWFKKASLSWSFGGGNFCYFTIHTNIKEFEVKRLYRGYRFGDKSTTHYFFVEILRVFQDGDTKVFFAKQRQMGSYYDTFTFSSTIELRGVWKNYAGYDISDLLDLSWDSHSQSRGKRVDCVKINPNELARVICNNPVAETLYKTKDPLFVHLLYENYNKQVCRAITIAKRHGFDFSNQSRNSLWFDMVRTMAKLDADWHNPVYIVPKDLQATHDLFIRRWERHLEELSRRAKIELKMNATDAKLLRDLKANEAYIRRRKRYYDMVLSDGLIECRVLRDIPAFREEAEYMNHCVYTGEYYKKPYSLIMSATIGNKKIETVEVDLMHFNVKQCFGKNDNFTIYHKRILDLVNSQMDTIKQFKTKRISKKKLAV